MDLPKTMAEGEGDEARITCGEPLVPQPDVELRESGSQFGLISKRASSTRGTPREGVERAPTAAQHVRHEQRRNLWLVPERVGRLMTNTSRGAERP
jgi:hypothetical protein